MTNAVQAKLAEKYYVDDLPGASLGGALLNGILQKIEAGDKLTTLAQSFLETNHLVALQSLTCGQIDREEFATHAARERDARIQKAQKSAVEAMTERTRQAEASALAIKAHFAVMANDPVLRRKREAKELRGRFDIGFVESEHLRRVMSLLRQVSDRQRL